MLSRYFVSFNIAALITFGLFFAMQALISNGEVNLIKEKKRLPHIIVQPREVREPETRVRPPEKAEVEGPPELTTIPFSTATDKMGPVIPVTLTSVGPEIAGPPDGLGGVDGIHIPIVRPAPQYPIRLLEKGIEGYVRVQFDITVAGNTDNVIAVESSHKGFESSAIKAAQKFKFKPSVIDGEAIRVKGVFNKIEFKLQD